MAIKHKPGEYRDCLYDNTLTNRREFWREGELLAWCDRKMADDGFIDIGRVMAHGGEWKSGQLLGNPAMMKERYGNEDWKALYDALQLAAEGERIAHADQVKELKGRVMKIWSMIEWPQRMHMIKEHPPIEDWVTERD